jgi:hypothetical protein
VIHDSPNVKRSGKKNDSEYADRSFSEFYQMSLVFGFLLLQILSRENFRILGSGISKVLENEIRLDRARHIECLSLGAFSLHQIL